MGLVLAAVVMNGGKFILANLWYMTIFNFMKVRKVNEKKARKKNERKKERCGDFFSWQGVEQERDHAQCMYTEEDCTKRVRMDVCDEKENERQGTLCFSVITPERETYMAVFLILSFFIYIYVYISICISTACAGCSSQVYVEAYRVLFISERRRFSLQSFFTLRLICLCFPIQPRENQYAESGFYLTTLHSALSFAFFAPSVSTTGEVEERRGR